MAKRKSTYYVKTRKGKKKPIVLTERNQRNSYQDGSKLEQRKRNDILNIDINSKQKTEDTSYHEELTDPIPIKDWKVEKSFFCRCCHSDSDVNFTLSSMALDTEDGEHSYADMIKDCFNIEVYMEEDSYIICSCCQVRLKDAHAFKRQVLACEARLQAARAPPIIEDEPLNPVNEANKMSVIKQDEAFVHVKEELEDNCNECERTHGESDEGDRETSGDEGPTDDKSNPSVKKARTTYKDFYERISSDQFRCLHCGDKVAATLREMKSHRDRLHKNRCLKCGETFRVLSEFLKHKIDKHQQDDRSKCNACDGIFPDQKRLKNHMKVFHKLGVKRKCEKCDYESYCAKRMRYHQKVHAPSRDFRCQYCKKTFVWANNLREHENIHTGVRNKVCSECGQAFVQKASLNYHMTKYHPNVKF